MLEFEDILLNIKKAHICFSNNGKWILFCFSERGTAENMLYSLKKCLVGECQDISLANVTEVKEHKNTPYRFRLSMLQYNKLKEKIYSGKKIQLDYNFLLKSLRADKYCFIFPFLDMLFPPNKPYPLRKLGSKLFYTVTGEGVFARHPKFVPSAQVQLLSIHYNQQKSQEISYASVFVEKIMDFVNKEEIKEDERIWLKDSIIQIAIKGALLKLTKEASNKFEGYNEGKEEEGSKPKKNTLKQISDKINDKKDDAIDMIR